MLNCIGINARSLKSLHTVNGKKTSNLSQFQDLVHTEYADLVFVTETWLNKDINDEEILPDGYGIYRKDRQRRAGGVLLAIRSNLFFSVREIIDGKCELELVY